MIQVRDGALEAWVPRGLISNIKGLDGRATPEGLVPVKVVWRQGRLQQFKVIQKCREGPKSFVLPRLAEIHAHLDKAFTWTEAHNLQGTYEEALIANFVEHRSRSLSKVRQRASKALERALQFGLRAVRSHVDSLGPAAEESWEALLELRDEWLDRIELQLVALRPLEHWGTSEGKHFARKIAGFGGMLGAPLAPPFDPRHSPQSLREMLQLADQLGCAVDLHIDEAQTSPAAGLKLLVRILDQHSIQVPITCSHASSMSLLPTKPLRQLAERLASHDVGVVALPLTNAWLLGRQIGKTPVQRPIAPIKQLQAAGVKVAVGGDNVQDPWFPGGDFDPLALMAMAVPLAQLAPWQRLGLSPFTTASAQLMRLDWDGMLLPEAPADLIVLEAGSWAEALASRQSRRILVGGEWLNSKGHLA